MSSDRLFAEDVPVGTRFVFGAYAVTRDGIVDFARRFDPLPIHTDDDAGEAAFGSIIASGAHTMAIYTRLNAEAFTGRAAVIAGLGIDQLRLPAPVRPEDVLSGHAEVVECRLRDDGRAIVRLTGLLHDELDRVVLTLENTVLMRRA